MHKILQNIIERNEKQSNKRECQILNRSVLLAKCKNKENYEILLNIFYISSLNNDT